MKPIPITLLCDHKPRGFALVITISLMVLLTLLAVGLLSLSSISLRASAQGSAIATARNNARLAMSIALGQLQKTAGQDQRATATADIASDANGIRIASGKAPVNARSFNNIPTGLTPVNPGTRFWTGVWDTVTPNAPPAQIYTKTPTATNVRWLVSRTEFTQDPANPITPSASPYSVSTTGTLSNPEKAVILAGPQTIGPASTNTIENYVSAPLVDMQITQGGTTNRGRYAWWIGDEGVKARINQAAPQSPSEPATYATLASQRAGWETVRGLENYPPPDSQNHSALRKIVTLPEATILLGRNRSYENNPTALFHSATTESLGVLADSLQGGLRIELGTCLENGFPAANETTFPNAPRNGNIIPNTVAARLKGPRWETLRAFHAQAKSAATDRRLTVKAAPANGYDITIAPLIVDFRLIMGAKPQAISASEFILHPCGKFAVCIANPYPYTLEWKSDLEFEFFDETPYQNNISSTIFESNRGPDGQPAAAYFSNKNKPAVFLNSIFTIAKGELAPGEARAYTMGSQVTRAAGNGGRIKVDLKPFSSSSPDNLDNSVIQLNNVRDNRNPLPLDVRESWTTTQPSLEMRLAGGSSGSILRRLDRFEFDNGYHAETKRPFRPSDASLFSRTFPIHLFRFQLSQPGGRYQDVFLSSSEMGTRNSTLRTFMDFNVRAARFQKLITAYNPPPYFMESTDALSDLPFTPPGGSTGSGFTRDLAINPPAWGRAPVGDVKKTILFSFPDQFTSLAQLQHADLTADDLFISVSHQPGNAFGNSYATPFVKRKLTIQSRSNYVVTGVNGGESVSSTKTTANYYDLSYLLNAALWDTFFFSSLDSYASRDPLNRTLTVAFPPTDPNGLRDPVRASSHLLVNGAFNVNSTSEDAWRALFAGNRFLKHPADGASSGTSDGALFPRSLEQTGPSATPPTGSSQDSFNGYRRLSPQQIDTLAEEMVKQVRLRGPFVSLSHFVNRALVDIASRTNAPHVPLSRAGALQSALDLSGANISPDGRKSAFARSLVVNDDKVKLQLESNAPKADLWGTQTNGSRGSTYGGSEDGNPVWANQSKDLNFGAVASIVADRQILSDAKLQQTELGFRSTGIPGWITQADVLQVIGPKLASRSDTFRIRAYGEALSSDGKTILAKAWCEAVVQRTPRYVDSANPPTDRDTSLTDTTLTRLNKNFGRRFEVVAFRWLSKDEI